MGTSSQYEKLKYPSSEPEKFQSETYLDAHCRKTDNLNSLTLQCDSLSIQHETQTNLQNFLLDYKKLIEFPFSKQLEYFNGLKERQYLLSCQIIDKLYIHKEAYNAIDIVNKD